MALCFLSLDLGMSLCSSSLQRLGLSAPDRLCEVPSPAQLQSKILTPRLFSSPQSPPPIPTLPITPRLHTPPYPTTHTMTTLPTLIPRPSLHPTSPDVAAFHPIQPCYPRHWSRTMCFPSQMLCSKMRPWCSSLLPPHLLPRLPREERAAMWYDRVCCALPLHIYVTKLIPYCRRII